jgi:hypothetical protein
LDVLQTERLIDELLTAELSLQNQKWGHLNERADVSNGELFCAALGQLDAIFDRRNGEPDAFESVPEVYPEGWSGFRSYGGDIPNIIVAAAFLLQEAKRLALAGEDYTRLARRPDQPYNPETGLPNEVVEA